MRSVFPVLRHWRHNDINVIKLQKLSDKIRVRNEGKKAHLRFENVRINLGGAFLENNDTNVVSDVALLMQLLALVFL